MDVRSLLTFRRHITTPHTPAEVIDRSASALQAAFGSDIAVVVLPAADTREVRVSGDHVTLPDPEKHPDVYRWTPLHTYLRANGVAHVGGAPLPRAHQSTDAAAPDSEGFIVVGWDERSREGVVESAAIELAAEQLASALQASRDAAELRQTSRALWDAQDQLARTRHLCLLGEITSGVAHDFNNALTTILGTTEWLLQNATLEDDARDDLTHIRTASTDAALYVRRLQEAARQIPAIVEQGERGAETAEADAGAAVVDLAEIAELMPALTKGRLMTRSRPGAPVEVEVDADPGSVVHGNAAELRELFQNLIFNALDAMHERGGRVTVRVRGTGDHVQLSVIDEGAGIPYDVRPHIFEPFYTTKGRDGCGLGLSVCWGIAQKHGGALEVESDVGRGTTVTLTLPAHHAAPSVAEDALRPAPSDAPTLRVLLIDDQPDVLESVRDMLKVLGHEVVVASDGEAGLAELGHQKFDVVVTDLGMPGLDGVGVATRVKQLQPLVPVILLTGWGALYAQAPPEAVAAVLPKPPTLSGLGQVLTDATSDVAA